MNQVIDREAVKTLAIAVGVREAARQLGLNEKRVLKWSERFNWLRSPAPKPQPPTITKNAVVTVVTPSTALQNTLANDSSASRIALSKATRKGSEHLGEAKPATIVRSHKALKGLADTASLVHGWNQDTKPGSPFNLNVLSQNTVIEIS